MNPGAAPARAIRAVIFDKDGVLVDFQRTWTPALRAAAVELSGGDEALALELLRRAGFDAATGRFLPGSVWAAGTNEELVDIWAQGRTRKERAALVDWMNRHCAAVEPVPLLPVERMRAALEGLKRQGMALALVSNDAEASVRGTVRHFGLEGMFDFLCGFDSVARPKPAADPVFAFSRFCGVPPEAMAVVGDNGHDGQMARAAGCAVFMGVLSGTSGKADLAPFGARIVPDMEAACALLASGAQAAQGPIDARPAHL